MMEAVFIKVLNMSISAGWLILAVMLLRLLLKKAPKWISVVLWGLVGLRLVLPFSLQSVFSLIPSAEVISPSIGYAQHPAINSGVSIIDNAVNPMLGTSLAATPMNSVNPMQIVLYLGGLVWVGGIAVLLLYGLISYLRLCHKVAEAISYEKNTWLCDHVKTPFILGVFRPRIYLPSGLNEEETAYVLAHEHAHLRRKDHLWKPLGFLLLTVYWFNPLVWVAYILLCRDIEAACDEKVISDKTMTEKKAYANVLVSCSMQRRLILACPLAFGEVGVKERVKGVLNYRKPAFWIILIAIFACIVLAICLMTDPFSNKSLSGKLGVSMDMAVAGHNHSSETEGHFVALDYDVLQISKTANRTTIYAWVMYEEYSFDGTDVKEESGSHIPTVITFDTSSENSDKSTYDVIEYWEPRDGSYYADDIRAKFPWSIRRKAFDVSGADQQHENCLRAAREYFGVGQNTAESSSAEFYLTIGADNVKSIVVTTPYTSGGCQNADGSLYRKGEQIWLEQLAGREDLRGVTITALDASETVIWTASVPNTEENRGFTRLTQDGWTISNLIDEAEELRARLKDKETDRVPEQSDTEIGGNEPPDNVFIKVKPKHTPGYGVSFRLPSDWTYEVTQEDDETTSQVRVSIRPLEPGTEGEITFSCSLGAFGVCGTGLEQKDIVFNGHEAWQGFYDGNPLWNFICLKDLPGCAVVNLAENWYEDYAHVIEQILPTVEFVYYSLDGTPTEDIDDLFIEDGAYYDDMGSELIISHDTEKSFIVSFGVYKVAYFDNLISDYDQTAKVLHFTGTDVYGKDVSADVRMTGARLTVTIVEWDYEDYLPDGTELVFYKTE